MCILYAFMCSCSTLSESFYLSNFAWRHGVHKCRPSQPQHQSNILWSTSMTTWDCVVWPKAMASHLWSNFLKKPRTKVLLSPFPFQNFLASTSCPEIQGYLYVKELGRKSWKKVYLFLRRSGLYCSTKGTSKVTEAYSFHLQRAELISIQLAFCVIAIIIVIIYHFQPHTHPTSHFIPMVSVIFQIKHNYLQRVIPLVMCPVCMHPRLSAPLGGFSLWCSDLLINSVSRSQGIYS